MSEAKKKKTYDDLWEELCALPDNVVGEILDGELVVTPRPSPLHANVSSTLIMKIGGPFCLGEGGGPGGWWILNEPQIHFPGIDIVPDIAGWKRDRLPELPKTARFELAPDWVCEVLSPSTARYDKISKLRTYADNKIPYYWIVDPQLRTLEVLTFDGRGYRLEMAFEGADRVSAPPFDAVEINLEVLWGV